MQMAKPLKRGEEEPCRCQEKRAECHLRDYQDGASPPAAARSDAFERCVGILTGCLKCRPQTEQQSGKQAHRDGETEDAKIRLDPDVQRQTGGVEVADRRKSPVQKWHCGKCDEQSARGAEKGE